MGSPEVDARWPAQGRQRPRVVIRGSSFQKGKQEVDEAILIEIATRFRKLEDVIERADLFLASQQEDYEKAIKKADADYDKHKNFGRFCREANEPEADLRNLKEIRDDLDKARDACRDDMVTMQEEIRKR